MAKFMGGVKSFWAREEALELSEYALMLGLLAVALVAAIGVLRGAIGGRFNTSASTISS